MLKNKKILFIGAHMDDIEFGCGGIISKYSGCSDIYVLHMSKIRRDSAMNIQEIRNLEEMFKAASVLGIKKDNVFLGSENISGQLFPECRQLILETLYNFGNKLNPDIVFFPYMDVHQDHNIVYNSCRKAFKRNNLFCYEIPNSQNVFNPNMYIKISLKDLENKIESINCYQSQLEAVNTPGDYFSEDKIRATSVFRGIKCGLEYAEAFVIENLII